MVPLNGISLCHLMLNFLTKLEQNFFFHGVKILLCSFYYIQVNGICDIDCIYKKDGDDVSLLRCAVAEQTAR